MYDHVFFGSAKLGVLLAANDPMLWCHKF